jgi:hypothetical protein
MLSTSKRAVFIVGWLVAALLIWAIPCNLFVFLMDYFAQPGAPISPWITYPYHIIAISGVFILLPIVAVLALRGKLPWTRMEL